MTANQIREMEEIVQCKDLKVQVLIETAENGGRSGGFSLDNEKGD